MNISIENLGWLVQVVSNKANRTYKIVELKGEHPNIVSTIIADNISEDDAYDNEVDIKTHNDDISYKKYNAHHTSHITALNR